MTEAEEEREGEDRPIGIVCRLSILSFCVEKGYRNRKEENMLTLSTCFLLFYIQFFFLMEQKSEKEKKSTRSIQRESELGVPSSSFPYRVYSQSLSLPYVRFHVQT